MEKKISYNIVLFLCCILLGATFSGCIKEEQKGAEQESLFNLEVQLDQPSVLPNWEDGDYHDYGGTLQMLNTFNDQYPDLVDVSSIGTSVLGKNIWCLRLTNERNDTIKSCCLIDGCIHGCEWEAGEACLYLAEYLLMNYGNNATVSGILNTTEVYVVPILNPDGRQKDDGFNDNGINLNRNFDVDFGRIRGGVFPLGKLFGRVKIPALPLNPSRTFTLLHKLFPSFPLWLTNCGRRPFSEPEAQALRDFTKNLNAFSFYVSCHTAVHCIIGPWNAFKPPFKMTQHEIDVLTYAEKWVEENTEYVSYGSGEKNVYQGEAWYSSGTSTDWVFKEYRIPSFNFEILSEDYESFMGKGKHDNLVHWMKTTLPVFMYLLMNRDNLRLWITPDIQPSLPEGIPPPPLQYFFRKQYRIICCPCESTIKVL